ncbi:DNA alkylation repair protein [uncultured Aggregatibacter sp.]|uniref:DNA alkylation repair protein n=1 Tax=uncultured Aggregatibacter sp. TaxID=470564 RepID=UPI0026168A5C|nr:DNA alkylation repair protein [uncultured Aggregatibacter sp.]
MPKIQAILTLLQNAANSGKAIEMAAYMKNQFDFLGIPTPLRRKLCKPLFKGAAISQAPDWDFVEDCWTNPYHEMQYIAMDYLNVVSKQLTPQDLPHIELLITRKSWWDSTDALDKVVGNIYLNFPEIRPQLIRWSQRDNIWLRRVAINCQLSLKQQTDKALLSEIIQNNFGQSEFFINKAIGWALREYGKTNPDWVKNFVQQHREKMAPLSVREALKRLK